MPKNRKTPAGSTRTGPAKENSRPLRRSGSDPEPITRLEVQTEAQSPAARKKTGSTGAEDMRQLGAERVPLGDEVERPYDGVRDAGPVNDEEE